MKLQCNPICDHQLGVAGGGAEIDPKALEKKSDPPHRKGRLSHQNWFEASGGDVIPPPHTHTHFASSRGKKDKKSERGRDKRDRSISRKRSHKEEDRIKGKTKSMKVRLT